MALPSWHLDLLDNGMRVVSTPIPTAQSASINIFVGVGSRAEEPRTNGISHYTEHMLFKGTARRPDPIIIAEAIEGSGGTLNAYTGKELTCYWDHVPSDAAHHALDVLADMVIDSLFKPEEIEKERTVVQQEIKRTRDVPGSWVGELLSQAVYGEQPIGWSIAGSVSNIDGIQRDDFLAHRDRWYRPNNMVLSVAGNIRHKDVLDWASACFAGLEAQPLPAVLSVEPNRPPHRVIVEDRPTAQCNLAMGMRTFGREDPDRFALSILANLLGRGMSSRLFREVREKRGLAYSVGASTSRYSDAGTFGISAGVSPENLLETTRVILDELRRLLDEPAGEEELTKVRDYTCGSFRLSLETAMAWGQRHGDSLLTMGRIESVDEVLERYHAVGAEDVQRVARRVFSKDNLAMAAVGPGLNDDQLEAVLTL